MKKLTRFAVIFLMMCGTVALSACSDPVDPVDPVDPIDPETLDTPAGLKVGTLTQTTAEFSWTAVEGAEKYNVVIDDGDAVDVAEASYTATGLTPETAYKWKVKAVKGDIVSEWAQGPGFTTPEEGDTEPVTPAPTDLTAVTTHYLAKLSWKHGGADSHQVAIGDQDPVTVAELNHVVVGLEPATAYTWKVRSCKNDEWSNWAESEFTTEPVPVPIDLEFSYSYTRYDGNVYMQGTSCIDLIFTDHDMYGDDLSGWLLELDLILDAVDDSPNVEYIDLTPGTYPFSSTKAPNIVYLSQFTIIREVLEDGYYVQPVPKITEGTVTITKAGTDYTMTVSLKVDDGRTINGSYTGPIVVKNPDYDPDTRMKFVKVELVEYGGSYLKNYFLRMWDESATNTGTGYVLALDLYAPGDSKSIIPDGLYTLGDAVAFEMDRYYSYLKTYTNGQEDDQDRLTSGTAEVTRTGDGTYTIVVDMLVETGLEIKTTYSGTVVTVPK